MARREHSRVIPTLGAVQKPARSADTPVMKSFRPLRTLGSTLALVAALVVALFAGQDLWHYGQAVTTPWLHEWARSSQGLWQLTCGVAEIAATVALLIAGVHLLGTRLTNSAPGAQASSA